MRRDSSFSSMYRIFNLFSPVSTLGTLPSTVAGDVVKYRCWEGRNITDC